MLISHTKGDQQDRRAAVRFEPEQVDSRDQHKPVTLIREPADGDSLARPTRIAKPAENKKPIRNGNNFQ